MAYFPVRHGSNLGQSLGCNPGTTEAGTTLINDGVANTKNQYVDVGGTLTYDAGGFRVMIENATVNDTRHSVDIAINDGGTRYIVASDLFFYAGFNGETSNFYDLPIWLPAGAQLSARYQSQNTTATIDIHIETWPAGFHQRSFTGAIGYGLQGTTTLQLITRPAGNNQKGAYAAITASTTRRHGGFIPMFSNSGSSTQLRLIDVAIGAAASEQIIIPDIPWTQNTGTDNMSPNCSHTYWPIDIPSGTRVSARVMQDVVGGGRDLLMGFVGLY